MPNYKPTDEQQTILGAIKSPESLMISAYAGCAKTSTLELCATKVLKQGLSLAFNKSIADSLRKRMPSNFTVKTLNALGFGVWIKSRGIENSEIDDRKIGRLLTATAKQWRQELSGDQWAQARDLVKYVSLSGVAPKDLAEGLRPDTVDTWQDIAREKLWLDEETFGYLYPLARAVWLEGIQMALRGILSFDDQIYCPTILGARFPMFPVVFVDEAQDLSPLQHAMLAKTLGPSSKLVSVGDPKQAIYAFRGADSASMGKIRGLRGEWLDLGLRTTFRCPKIVVDRQQVHAPGFRAGTRNLPGSLMALGGKEIDGVWTEGWLLEDLWKALPKPGASVAVLCRNNAPLLAFAFKLIRAGVGPVMLGRDLGTNLIALSKKIAKDPRMRVEEFREAVGSWKLVEQSKVDEDQRGAIADRAGCLLAVADGPKDVGEVRLRLEALFSRQDGRIQLSTIHRAKGLEWDVVVHLDPWRVPSKQAKRAALEGDPRAMEQELNLRYVCETRTRDVLILADLAGFEGSERTEDEGE